MNFELDVNQNDNRVVAWSEEIQWGSAYTFALLGYEGEHVLRTHEPSEGWDEKVTPITATALRSRKASAMFSYWCSNSVLSCSSHSLWSTVSSLCWEIPTSFDLKEKKIYCLNGARKREAKFRLLRRGGGHLIRLGASTSAGYIRRASFTCRSRTDRRAQDCRRGKQLIFHHEQG